MKLGTILANGSPIVVVERRDRTFAPAAPALDLAVAPSAVVTAALEGNMRRLVEHWPTWTPPRELPTPTGEMSWSEDALTWLPPVQPSKVCCVALNNRSMDRDRISAPEHPAFFNKAPSSLIGHRQPIVLKERYGLTHPEPELAVIIGSRITDVDVHGAREAIFGMTILNDVTSVDMRIEDHFHFRFKMPATEPGVYRTVEHHTTYAGRYKSADTFGPLGPVIVTADELSDSGDLRITCIVDGHTVQDDQSSNYRYNAAEAISFISQFQTLEAGDIVSLGTALGSASEPLSSTDLRTLPSDVRITIESVGSLTNPVVAWVDHRER